MIKLYKSARHFSKFYVSYRAAGQSHNAAGNVRCPALISTPATLTQSYSIYIYATTTYISPNKKNIQERYLS